jgi:thiol-disulfide isomerase/thioredoxin
LPPPHRCSPHGFRLNSSHLAWRLALLAALLLLTACVDAPANSPLAARLNDPPEEALQAGVTAIQPASPSPTPFQPVSATAPQAHLASTTPVAATRPPTSLPSRTPPPPTATLPGYAAASFDLAALNADGAERISLENLHGRPVVLNFFATWCSPCRQEIPLLSRLYTQNKDRVHFVAIALGESAPTVKQFIQAMRITYPVLLDSQRTTERAYRIRGIPTTYFLDTNGRIVDQHLGVLTEEALQKYLNELTGP